MAERDCAGRRAEGNAAGAASAEPRKAETRGSVTARLGSGRRRRRQSGRAPALPAVQTWRDPRAWAEDSAVGRVCQAADEVAIALGGAHNAWILPYFVAIDTR